MRTITIEYGEHGSSKNWFDVVDEYGRRAQGLCFGEMLEQIVGMTHPTLGRPPYRMATEDEWRAEEERAAARRRAAQAAQHEIDTGGDEIPF